MNDFSKDGQYHLPLLKGGSPEKTFLKGAKKKKETDSPLEERLKACQKKGRGRKQVL